MTGPAADDPVTPEAESAIAEPTGSGATADPGESDRRYLAAAMAWLRAHLERAAGLSAAERSRDAVASTRGRPLEPTAPDSDSALAAAMRASVPPPDADADGQTHDGPADPGSHDPDERIAAAAAAMAEAATAEPQPSLVFLAARLGLTPFEQSVLLLCIGMELDPRFADLCAAAHGDPQAAHPTFALAFELFDDPTWDVVTPGRPLRYWRLIEIVQPNGRPLTRSVLRADERIVSLAKGLNYLDDRLEPLFLPVDHAFDLSMLAPSQHGTVDDLLRRLRHADGIAPTVNIVGPDASTKQLFAAATAWVTGRRLHTMAVELLPAGPDDLETLARLWEREAMLLPLALFLDAHDVDPAADGPARHVPRFLARSGGLTFLGSRDRWTGLLRPAIVVEAPRPSSAEQRERWQERLVDDGVEGGNAEANADALAGQFRLDLPEIQRTVTEVVEDVGPTAPDLGEALWDTCLALTRPRLDALAQRVDVRPTWDDFVLAEPHLGLLHQLADQVGQRTKVYETWGFGARMNRGLGISALFTGSSGTGKSMAAEVIAAELRLDLYRIDLSAVVSKYIGETEKNLRRLFDAAEDGGALLFFDEADALFGKRSEVKDSHDRYANIEINYLLQRMESYRGLAILATNMRNALDPAFVRRIRFIVEFPFPSLPERRTMWAKVFPAEVPTERLDFDRLASLPATGGMIHNIALNAAFIAAHRQTSVSMATVLEAARTEFRKQDMPVLEREFAWSPDPVPA